MIGDSILNEYKLDNNLT
jgi:hypothetical protein